MACFANAFQMPWTTPVWGRWWISLPLAPLFLLRKLRDDPLWWLHEFLSSRFLSNLMHFIQRSLFEELWRLCGVLQIWAFVAQNAAIDAGLGAVHSSFHGYLLLIFSGQAADRLIRLICRKAVAYLSLTLQIVILFFLGYPSPQPLTLRVSEAALG